MKKQFLAGITVLLVLAGVQPVFAQQGEKSTPLIQVISTKETAKNLKVDNEYAAMGIQVERKNTPQIQYDEHQETVSKNEKKSAVPWLQISVPFRTLAVAADRKNKDGNSAALRDSWLEDVDIDIELIVPVLNHNGKKEYGILKGTATLAPVRNHNINAGTSPYIYHNVKFYVSPYIVARYIMSSGVKADKLEKMIPDCPVRVLFRYGKQEFGGVKIQSKRFDEQAKALGLPAKTTKELFTTYDKESRSLYTVPGGIIPAGKTPWAWIDYDHQEHTLDDVPRR